MTPNAVDAYQKLQGAMSVLAEDIADILGDGDTEDQLEKALLVLKSLVRVMAWWAADMESCAQETADEVMH